MYHVGFKGILIPSKHYSTSAPLCAYGTVVSIFLFCLSIGLLINSKGHFTQSMKWGIGLFIAAAVILAISIFKCLAKGRYF